MISAELAGGDCLNAGCVPSKALLRCAKLIKEVRKATIRNNEYGILLRVGGIGDGGDGKDGDVEMSVDFPKIMERMRKLRSDIAPIDGHARGTSIGTQVFQGRGRFVSKDRIEVIEYGKACGDPSNPVLHFDKAVIATGGRPRVPTDVPGLVDAPYTTNLDLFNLMELPSRMVVLGGGVIAMEMAQAFAIFGTKVTVISSGRSGNLLNGADDDAVRALRGALEDDGVTFVTGAKILEVDTLRRVDRSSILMEETDSTTTTATMGGDDDGDTQLPLMKISYTTTTRNGNNDDDLDGTRIIDLECECLLVAVGRVANVDSLGLDDANVEYDPINGILVDEYSKSITNPNVYAVGDCVAYVPRLTHGEGRALMSTSPPKKQIHYIYRSSRDIVLKAVLTLSSFSHAIFKRIIVPD
jgi:pyruvate/2-oxoglutarate dehydrogenase complex dihydrolipoamide dehydrogenase (E3) component